MCMTDREGVRLGASLLAKMSAGTERGRPYTLRPMHVWLSGSTELTLMPIHSRKILDRVAQRPFKTAMVDIFVHYRVGRQRAASMAERSKFLQPTGDYAASVYHPATIYVGAYAQLS